MAHILPGLSPASFEITDTLEAIDFYRATHGFSEDETFNRLMGDEPSLFAHLMATDQRWSDSIRIHGEFRRIMASRRAAQEGGAE